MELYNGLATPLLAVDERLDVLLNVKWTVQEFDCPLARDIVELCDREADLLNRGRSASSVDGLRKRILNLFLQFIETPDFNPESKRFLKVGTRGHVAIARDARRATAMGWGSRAPPAFCTATTRRYRSCSCRTR